MTKKEEIIKIYRDYWVQHQAVMPTPEWLKGSLDSYATTVLKEVLGKERKKEDMCKKLCDNCEECDEGLRGEGHNTHRQTAITKAKEKFGLNLK